MFGQKNKKRDKEIETDLNRVITPMLDMTFQILFFLIMNFRLPTPEGQIDLLLPKEEEGQPISAPEDKLDEDKSDEYRLRLFINRDQGDQQGVIAGMTWKPKKTPVEPINPIDPTDAGEKDDYFLKLDPMYYGLVVKLREFQPKEGGKQPSIKLECDKKLRYSELLKIMDITRKMKFTNVGVMPIPKDKG